MADLKTDPDSYFENSRSEGLLKNPSDLTEELFLIGKLTEEKIIKDEVEKLLSDCPPDIIKAFKDKSKFAVKNDRKSNLKNLALLCKLAEKSNNLKIGKLYCLLEGEILRVFEGDPVPGCMGRFDGIKELWLSTGYDEISVPESISEIESLEILIIDGSKINLPDTLGNLKNLKKLEIELDDIDEIPHWISKLSTLEELRFGGADAFLNLKKMPDLRKLKNLKKLKTGKIETESLPDYFFDLPNLEFLELVNIKGLKKIPSSINKLKNLKSLTIANLKDLEEVPKEINDLKKLSTLHMGTLPKLAEIDGSIIFSDRIKELYYYRCNAKIDMGSISKSGVKSLSIRDINLLNQLLENADSFEKLESLELIDLKGLKEVPDGIGNLKNLKDIKGYRLEIETLPESFCSLSNLTSIEIHCDRLSTLPESFEKLKSLRDLKLVTQDLTFKSAQLPKNLKKIYIWGDSADFNEAHKVKAENLHLRVNKVGGSKNTDQFNSLKEFDFTRGEGLPFSDISKLTGLTRLSLSEYSEITKEVISLKALTELESIYNGPSFIADELGKLPNLTRIQLNKYPGENISNIIDSSNSLEDIELNYPEALKDREVLLRFLKILKSKKQIKRLKISLDRTDNVILKNLTQLTQLESLNLTSFGREDSADTLPESILKMKNLNSLTLHGLNLKTLPEWIGELKSLEVLEVESMYDNTGFILPVELTKLPKLKKLSIYGLYPKSVPKELKKLKLEVLKIHSSKARQVRQEIIDILTGADTLITGK